MHDLLIFLATLGGIFLFGLLGFIIGPIVAALFVTVWDIYGVAFRDVLPEVEVTLADLRGGVDEEAPLAGIEDGHEEDKTQA